MHITPEAHAAIRRALAALQASGKAAPTPNVPRYLHTGDEVKSLEEVAGLMGTTTTSAARHILESGRLAHLRTEAVKALQTQTSDKGGVALMLTFSKGDATKVSKTPGVATGRDDLHCTVAYFGDVGDTGVPNEYELLRIARKIGRKHEAFDAKISAVTHFEADGPLPYVALLSAPEFEDIRQMVTSSPVGPFVNREHGYTPHMTLGYEMQGDADAIPDIDLPTTVMRVTGITLGYGTKYTTYALAASGEPEEKSIVRRVRTAAGVRKFGQPIGTVIHPDLVPGVPQSALRNRPKRRKRRSQTDEPTVSRAAQPDDLVGPQTRKIGPDRPVTLDGMRWTPVLMPKDSSIRKWNFYPETRDPANNNSVIAHNGDNPGSGYVVFIYRNGELVNQTHHETWEEARKFAVTAEAQRKQSEGHPVKRVPYRKSVPYWDKDRGTYGYDYVYEGETLPTDDELENPADRMEWVSRQSDMLGITIFGMDDEKTGTHADMDIEAQEIINRTAAVYEELFPGYTELMHTYEMGVPDDGFVAANRGNASFYYWAHEISTANRVESGPTMMLFKPEYWSAQNPDSFKDLAYSATKGYESGFFVNDIERIAKDSGDDTPTISALSVINHEHGHTVARAIFGELGVPRSDDDGSLKLLDHTHSKATAKRYHETVAPILKKYGIAREDDEFWDTSGAFNPYESATIDASGTSDQKTGAARYSLNQKALGRHLSRYGATNMHEMMAETWAGYMLDPEPTEFVMEMGSAMESLFREWWAGPGQRYYAAAED